MDHATPGLVVQRIIHITVASPLSRKLHFLRTDTDNFLTLMMLDDYFALFYDVCNKNFDYYLTTTMTVVNIWTEVQTV